MAAGPDRTDRSRLRQVQQQDLTESRLNDDFVYWLKTKGVNWLLVILVIACVVMGYNRYREWKQQGVDTSWADMNLATLPQAYDEVAKKHATTDPIALYGWLMAAHAHLRDVQAGYVGGPPTANPDGTTTVGERLTPEARAAELDAAEAYLKKVVQGASANESTPGGQTFAISALFGLATAAEARGDVAAARTALEQAKAKASTSFPTLAQQAQVRLDSLAMLEKPIEFPSRASLPISRDGPAINAAATAQLLNSVQTPSASAPEAPPPSGPAPVIPTLPPELRSNQSQPAAPPSGAPR